MISQSNIEITPFFINYSPVVGRNRLFINFMPEGRSAMFAKVNYGNCLSMLNESKAFEFLRSHNIPPYNLQYPYFYFQDNYSFSVDFDYLSAGYKTVQPSDANSDLINNLELLPSQELDLSEVRKLDWYSRIPPAVNVYLKQNFDDVLFQLKPCHGDLTSRNIFSRKNKVVLIDWECFSEFAPRYVDQVGLILYQNFSLFTSDPRLSRKFFDNIPREHDLLLALIYLSYITGSPLSRRILSTNYSNPL